jgi:hypothetical protein
VTRKPRTLPSGLIEGSAAANAAERAESEAFDRLHGTAPTRRELRTDRRPARARAYGDALNAAIRTR